jgi:hypothetical protein
MLHTFLAAFEAVLVVGPTLPDSWAETKEEKRMAVTAEKIVNFILVRITHKCKEWNASVHWRFYSKNHIAVEATSLHFAQKQDALIDEAVAEFPRIQN